LDSTRELAQPIEAAMLAFGKGTMTPCSFAATSIAASLEVARTAAQERHLHLYEYSTFHAYEQPD
jgi:enolase